MVDKSFNLYRSKVIPLSFEGCSKDVDKRRIGVR